MMFPTRRSSEEGSIPLAMLATIVMAGLITVVLTTVMSGQQQTQFDERFERSLQVAEGGLDRAIALVSSRTQTDSFCLVDGTATAGACSSTDPANGGYVVEAVSDAGGAWEIRSRGKVLDTARLIQVEIEPKKPFSFAAFGKFFAKFNGGNGADSYRSGTWSADFSTFSPIESPHLICRGSSRVDQVNDPTRAENSNQYICANGRWTENGIVATNGALNLLGNTYEATDKIEVHHARAPYVPNPYTDATGYCEGDYPTCQDAEAKIQYFREPLPLPEVLPECNSFESNFPANAGQNLLGAGAHCFNNVRLDSNTIIQGTPTNPTRIYLSGTLTVPEHQAVNFENVGTAEVPIWTPRPAPSLLIYSSGTGPSLVMGNHSAFAGAIYAPNAGFQGGAQGNVYGSLVAGTIDNNGGWNFHYDESLRDIAANVPLHATGWKELAP